MKHYIAITAVLAAISAGCVSEQIEAPTVRPWEGRYPSKSAVIEAASEIRLEKGESVWMLSNSTLKRLLKTTKE